MNTEELLSTLEKIETQLKLAAENYCLPDFPETAEIFAGESELLNNKLDMLTYMSTISLSDQISSFRTKINDLLKYVSFRRKYFHFSADELELAIDHNNYITDFQVRLSRLESAEKKKIFIDGMKEIRYEWNVLFSNSTFGTFLSKL